MEIFLIVLFICCIISLFCLYITGREDIVFIRKNVTTEHLFNLTFLTVLVGLFSSRLVDGVIFLKSEYLNPLVFLLFPYFPGLSFIGGVVGACVFLFLFTRAKKMPTGRLFDYFTLALFAALPLGYIGSLFLRDNLSLFENIYLPLVYFILFLFFLKLIFPKILRNELKSGTLGTFALLTFSFTTLLVSIMSDRGKILWEFQIEDILTIMLLVASIIVLIKQEMISIPGKK